jgi:hypothetical protein
MARRAAGRRDRDAGSVLILAFIYLTAVSVTVVALASWSQVNLRTSHDFSTVRTLQDAARSTTELAMQNIRYTPMLSTSQTLNASPPRACWGSGAASGMSNVNGYSIDVWCTTVWNPESAATRVVTFSTCLSTVSATQCAASPYLQAVVTYDDYPPGGAEAVEGPCTDWNWCGQGMTVDSWIWA